MIAQKSDRQRLLLVCLRGIQSLVISGGLLVCQTARASDSAIAELQYQFARQVDHRLALPLADQARYIKLLERALTQSGIVELTPQMFLLVDRSPSVQAAFLLLFNAPRKWHWIGATSVSTGKPEGFEHFITPTGIFLHAPHNPDYRATGAYNENHIRGYGVRGMRVYDFGWQLAERGWGNGGISRMRLAMHATDPVRLEGRLGTVASEGCIRIPTSLNHFLDHYGILDLEYESALKEGKAMRVLLPDRQAVPWQGRYMVVIDSESRTRPHWASRPSVPLNKSGQKAIAR